MKSLGNSEKLTILISLSNKLWEDYTNGDLKEKEYLLKSDEIRDEINKIHDVTFSDLQMLASKIGYLLINKKKAFSNTCNFIISVN